MKVSKRATWEVAGVFAALAASVAFAATPPALPTKPPVTDDGTMTTPSFQLPFSSFASAQARESFVKRLRAPMSMGGGDIASTRKSTDEKLAPQLEHMA